ncbi:MAG: hypothetical protein LBT25_12455 [Candidatus Symbiothrix sp.]|nr:hypothetical protein [Candidatus Symbiothrix sp.]
MREKILWTFKVIETIQHVPKEYLKYIENYDFEWYDTEWLNDPVLSTTHDIDFSLLGLKKGIYTIRVKINPFIRSFRYLIDF